MLQVPVGVSDFRKLIEYRNPEGDSYLFVDKSLFIKDILSDPSEAILITRPRRFGKSLNLSMLHHFFAKEVDDKPTANLFTSLNIALHPAYMKYQGQYPVIFLSFRNMTGKSFEEALQFLSGLCRELFAKHRALLSENVLFDEEREIFEAVLQQRATQQQITHALKNLTYYLYRYHGVKPIVLIDEYDAPIQTAYFENYYEDMVKFMQNFLSAGLKDNTYLEKAVLTGILRVSKESLFSGLNNVKVYSILDFHYDEYFGFTESEVANLLSKTKLNQNMNAVTQWYNGYHIGKAIIYNPWSIVNYIRGNGTLSAYWVNSGDSPLIQSLIMRSSSYFKMGFEALLQNKKIEVFIDEHFTFNTLGSSETSAWALLLMAGYLNATIVEQKGQGALCSLTIPNAEVRSLYHSLITRWLSGIDNPMIFDTFFNNLLKGNVKDFSTHLKRLMLQTSSVYDAKGNEPEKFFHGFMLGLVASIDNTQYFLQSNKETGYGRFDICIIPRNPEKLGIVIEVKSIKNAEIQTLNDAAKKALQQINRQEYSTIFSQHNIRKCLQIGIAFSGKDLAVEHEIVNLLLHNN